MDYTDQLQTIKDNVPKVYEAGYAAGSQGASVPVDQTYDPDSERAQSGRAVAEAVGSIQTNNGTVVSQNADFAEVAEWADGNPDNEDRTGYFVCANVPVNGIIMRKATSLDDVKGVSILSPAFAGNYSKDKLDEKGNLLPKYSFVAIIGFVPVRDNGTCEVGGRCMPDDNGCAVPSSNSMGYQVVNRIDENRVLIIIEPNGDMVQRIKSKMNKLQEDVDNLAPDQTYDPESENAQSGIAVAEAIAKINTIKEYEKINTITVSADENGNLPKWVEFSKDSNENPFELDSFYVITKAGFTDGTSSTYYVKVNGNYLTQNIPNIYNNSLRGSVTAFRHQTDEFIEFSVSAPLNDTWGYNPNGYLSRQLLVTPDKAEFYPVKKIALGTLTGTNKTWLEGSKFELWGVRK